jgi:hypothetical protein
VEEPSLDHRYYDPATGEFLSLDPTVATTTTPYVYAGADPVNAIDPDGLDCGAFSFVCGAYDATSGAVKEVGHAVIGTAKEQAHYAIDAETDIFYLGYWGALDLNGAIHWSLGRAFGSVGCDIANIIGAPLVPQQAIGLGADVAGDWVKEHVLGIPHYKVGDEGTPNAYLFGSQAGPLLSHIGINWRHDFPGVHTTGRIDWWW